MAENIKSILGEGLGLDAESQNMILEAWEKNLSEARKEIAAEMRAEFAKKAAHDKKAIVEAMGQFVETRVSAEIKELAEDKEQLRKAAIEYKKRVAENIKSVNKFIVENLSKELGEFRQDRVEKAKSVKKLESFILESLAKEITEFNNDKKALQEQRVKLIKEGKKAIAEAKHEFIKSAAQASHSLIEKALRKELSQLKEDIDQAKKNEFGRKIFEAYAAEFLNSHLNENTEISNILRKTRMLEQKLAKSQEAIAKQQALNEEANRKLLAAKDMVVRERKMNKLLGPLPKDKKQIMSELLESVQTESLEAAYNRYLPAVLNETDTNTASKVAKKPLKESAEVSANNEKTGDRVIKESVDQSNPDIDALLRLAGIK